MSTLALTGAHGFLGWHVRAAVQGSSTQTRAVPVGDAFDVQAAAAAVSGADSLLHIAGVNRGSDREVVEGNVSFATQVSAAIEVADIAPARVVFANSIQCGNGTVYGDAKAAASAILAAAAARAGVAFLDIEFPNLFGEYGRPFYNAVTATFSHLLAEGGTPKVDQDKRITLMHAQDAADLLTGAVGGRQSVLEVVTTVSDLLDKLTTISSTYSRGEVPDVSNKFDRDLFNTYRSYTFPSSGPVRLQRHSDSRGSFFEIIRSHGGTGQSSFSTTEPGISRGDHFHRRKIERFTVLSGSATIALRKLFTSEVVEFEVNGEQPVAVDMPTMWSHKITNTGSAPLYTSFWTNDIFDPEAPDTIAEAVHQ